MSKYQFKPEPQLTSEELSKVAEFVKKLIRGTDEVTVDMRGLWKSLSEIEFERKIKKFNRYTRRYQRIKNRGQNG